MTAEAEIQIGYHIKVRIHPVPSIAIHAPTEHWQHRPRASPPKSGFWVGPFATREGAEQVGEALANEYGYPVGLCKICFPDLRTAPPAQGEGAASVEEGYRRRRASLTPSVDVHGRARRWM